MSMYNCTLYIDFTGNQLIAVADKCQHIRVLFSQYKLNPFEIDFFVPSVICTN